MSAPSWLKLVTPGDKEQQAYLLHAGVLPALLPAIERLLEAAGEFQLARTKLHLVPLLEEYLTTLARQQPADPVAALVTMLTNRPNTVEFRPENSQTHDSSRIESDDIVAERRLLALYLRNSGPAGSEAAPTTRLRLPLAALAKGNTRETLSSSFVKQSTNPESLGDDQRSFMMTPRASFSLTPRLTGRRTARSGNGSSSECDSARAVGDGSGLIKLSECTKELEVILTLRCWQMDAFFDPSTGFFHFRAVEERKGKGHEATGTASSDSSLSSRSFTPRLGTPPTCVEVALSSTDFWRFAATFGDKSRTDTTAAAAAGNISREVSEDMKEAARFILKAAVLEPLNLERGSKRAKGSGFVLKFQKPPPSSDTNAHDETPSSSDRSQHSGSVVWSKTSKRIGGRIYVVEVIVEPRSDTCVDRAFFDRTQECAREEKKEGHTSQHIEKRHENFARIQSEPKESSDADGSSDKQSTKGVEEKEEQSDTENRSEKKVKATLPTQLPGKMKVLMRFQLYDPLTSTYLEASSLLIAAPSLEERRMQVHSAMRCLNVVTTPLGPAAVLRICTQPGTTDFFNATSSRSSDHCTSAAWTVMLSERPPSSQGISRAVDNVSSHNPMHSPKLYPVEVELGLTSPDSSPEANGRPRLLVQARAAPPPLLQSAPSPPPPPHAHVLKPSANSALAPRPPVVLLMPMLRDLSLVSTQFEERSMAVLKDLKSNSSNATDFEPIKQLIQDIAIQFLHYDDNNTDSVVKPKSENLHLRLPNGSLHEELKCGEEHDSNESSRLLHTEAWALAYTALTHRNWALWHPTAEQAGAEIKLSQLSRRVAAARALDAAVAAVLTPEKDEPVMHSERASSEVLSTEVLSTDCDDSNGKFEGHTIADFCERKICNTFAEPKVSKPIESRHTDAVVCAKGTPSTICSGRISTDSYSDEEDGSDNSHGSDDSSGAKGTIPRGTSFAAKIARGGKRRSLVELSTTARRERDALWETKGELVFRRAQQLGGRHTIVSVHILRPAVNINHIDNVHNSAASQRSIDEEARSSHREIPDLVLQEPAANSAAGAVRISAHDPETCLDSEVTMQCWDVDSPVGLGSNDATAQRRAAQFLCNRLQVGGRSGLTVFPFEADATAVALLAAVLAIPFNQKSHKAPRDSVVLAIESIENPSRWVEKVLRSVVDAKNDNNDLSFEDLVETMERAWGSMV